MCVAAIALNAHPRWPLVVIGNRDEFHARAAAPLTRWDEGIMAGRDLVGGGTWLGLNPAVGRLALVTNYRLPGYPLPDRASRGDLVTGWLRNGALANGAAMNPFNLLLLDQAGAQIVSNHPTMQSTGLTDGIYGLSNGAFTDQWPKSSALCKLLGGDDFAPDSLFAALRDEAPLPGDGPDAQFSSVFIRNDLYGTRCSTVIMVDQAGQGTIIERSYDQAGAISGEANLAFDWPIA